MTPVVVLLAVIIMVLILGWWLNWLATRLGRAHDRADRTWASLDAALIRRAERSLELVADDHVDSATALLLCDAAASALDANSFQQREQAESTLSQVLAAAGLVGVRSEQDRVDLARRFHNDAVTTARMLRNHKTVRLFRLAGQANQPVPFEIA